MTFVQLPPEIVQAVKRAELERRQLRKALKGLVSAVLFSDCYKHLPDETVKEARRALYESEDR